MVNCTHRGTSVQWTLPFLLPKHLKLLQKNQYSSKVSTFLSQFGSRFIRYPKEVTVCVSFQRTPNRSSVSMNYSLGSHFTTMLLKACDFLVRMRVKMVLDVKWSLSTLTLNKHSSPWSLCLNIWDYTDVLLSILRQIKALHKTLPRTHGHFNVEKVQQTKCTVFICLLLSVCACV